jgi:hypothetical protein
MPNVSTRPWTTCLPMSLGSNTRCVNVYVVWTFWGHSKTTAVKSPDISRWIVNELA